MPGTFFGDLSQTKVFDILKPLLTEKKTGRVAFMGKEEGEIYLEMGNIIHSKTPHSSGESAFFNLMGWNIGRILFEPEVAPKEKTISITTEQLLPNWSSRKQEMEKIREVIPSAHHIFRLSLLQDGGDKNISADQWNVLAMSNGMRSIAEVAKTLNWDEFKTLKIVYQLIQMGLLAKAEGEKPLKKKWVGEDFFQKVEHEFKKVMGPVAPFIIDDKLIEFGEPKDSFPQDEALPFIEALGEEIPHPLKREEFIKVAMGFLSHAG